MPEYRFVTTPLLDIGYLEWNPQGRRTAVLVHGWPDSPESWAGTAPLLAAAGYRVLAPALRGFAPTTFRAAATRRSGELAALGRDLLDFIDALALERPLLVGHDWGARAVANACGLRAQVACGLVMLSVGYGTNDPHQALSYQQARNYWYHWWLATPRGQHSVEHERHAFARTMWDTWAPQGWYREQDFDVASRAFDGPDWAAVVLHSYRHRWGFADGDARYADDNAMLDPAPLLAVPTLVLHGGVDTCNHPDSSKDRERFFSGPYRRLVLDGVGHFPQREAPLAVARAILSLAGGDE
ncbi:alpha/beta fold hydrolase [Janthinobacterium agaricidamnosum]|uniref:Alpha/beta hydrolase fold family protein n=1 Tax=Janthinobacterium agaricidamnosum NBRC 102515 = DSM 9628 TaxID=1349767 RepID=W0V847_9BURK|nr:alpha/beta hydrolase [Janthinobacterium agaricidamnosum]CDG84984.1 alpha/beta hydrolase fold family protein [Janthinobacterium agaricidamnosum NBRC 102515 = DSM 9628]